MPDRCSACGRIEPPDGGSFPATHWFSRSSSVCDSVAGHVRPATLSQTLEDRENQCVAGKLPPSGGSIRPQAEHLSGILPDRLLHDRLAEVMKQLLRKRTVGW